MCRVYSLAEADNEEPPNHCCPKNYDGLSKAMEADAALQLYKKLYNGSNKNIVLKAVVADDDSPMRALLTHKAVNPKGRLPEEMSQLEWLADPSHRTKVVAKLIFLLSTLPMSSSACTRVDAIRFKKYLGYMIKENRSKKISEIVFASKALVEHLFNYHDYCNSNWCRPKKQFEGTTDKEKGKELSTSFYRNKYNNAKLYNQIKKAYLPYTTEARLKESLHLYDTQKNEAMNNSIAKYATKTKTYGMTISLTNRVMIAIGVSNLGAEAYWKQVYSMLVIPMSPETSSFLQNQDKYRSYRSTYAKKTEVKKHRVDIQN